MTEYLKKNKFNICVMTIYLIISFFIMIFHEAWRDEAQSWLIARDLSFIDILRQMKFEGHLFLWYYILAPFAKLGFPYITINIISWIITSLSVYLILKKSPFSKIIKILLIFSMPFIYLFPAIARCYCLIPLAIVLIAITYEKRKEKPIRYVLSIILLANTHVIMFALVGMMLLSFYLEQFKEMKKNTKEKNKKIIYSIILAVILLSFTLFPIVESLHTNKEVNNNYNLDFEILINRISGVTMQFIICLFGASEVTMYAILILIGLVLVYEFKYYTSNAIIIMISISYQYLIYSIIYFLSEQRAASIFCIILLFAWIQKYDNNKNDKQKSYEDLTRIILCILIIMNILVGNTSLNKDMLGKYSMAKETAEYIKENINEATFICTNVAVSSSIIPHFSDNGKYEFWNPNSQQNFTYVTWDGNNGVNYDIISIKEKIKENFNKSQTLYLLYSYNSQEDGIPTLENDEDFIKVYENGGSITGEDYKIYSINKKMLED